MTTTRAADRATAPEGIRVYDILDAGLLHDQADFVKGVLIAAMGGLAEKDVHFLLDDYSGWVACVNNARMYSGPAAGTEGSVVGLQSSIEASWRFLGVLREVFDDPNRNPLLKTFPTAQLLPRNLYPADVQPVFLPDGKGFDHWLCRYTVSLPSSRSAPGNSEVLGATIEARVDPVGDVISYNARWSPITGAYDVVLPLPPPEPTHDHDEGTRLVYAQDNVAATRLLPYYLDLSGHHGALLPASTHSITVDIVQRNDDSGARISPWIVGGSGAYALEWFAWEPATIRTVSAGTRLGAAHVVRVGPGVHNVTLVVTDSEYRTRVEFAKTVVVPGPARRPPPRNA